MTRYENQAAIEGGDIGGNMISALLSILFGIAAFVVPIPVVVPIIGGALGANALIRESRAAKDGQRMWVKVVAGIGAAICCLAVLLFFVTR